MTPQIAAVMMMHRGSPLVTKIWKIIENPWRIARTSNEFGIWYWNSVMPWYWNSPSCCSLNLSLEKQPRKWIAPRMKMSAYESGSRTTAAVVQEIVHPEPAAARDEVLLAEQANHQWASDVERLLHGAGEGANAEPAREKPSSPRRARWRCTRRSCGSGDLQEQPLQVSGEYQRAETS